MATMLRRLRVLSSTPSSIKLSWGETEGPPLSGEQNEVFRAQYMLQIRDTVQGWIPVYWGFRREFEVTGLRAQECYQFRLKLITAEGEGPWSPQLAATTEEDKVAIVNLFRAIQHGQLEAAKKILTNRYDSVEIFNPMGISPLMQAVSRGDPQMVNLILSAGAGVNVTSGAAGRTALMIACFRGEVNIAHQLIDCGARWDICDRNGCTALHYAVDGSQMETVELALDEGADREAKDSEQWTPLMRGVVMESSVEILRQLLTRGAMLNCVDRRGQTCLMHAVLSGRLEVVKLLVDLGADLAPYNVYQNTALDIAKARGLKEVIQVLTPETARTRDMKN